MNNQREIKFRVWDKNDSEYISNYSLKDFAITAQGSTFVIGSRGGKLWDDKRFIWEQYTGLKDKNGGEPKEIYKGDKIRSYKLEYWEQRSFPEYIDCCGLKLVEVIQEVLFEEGMFCFKVDNDYVPIAWRIQEVIPNFTIIEGEYIEIDGYEFDGDEKDLQQLLIFEVIGNIHEVSDEQ